MSTQGPPPAGRVVSHTLVGRGAELARLVATVGHAPALAVVEGEPGIGKSRLVAELAGHPELAGRRVLTGACARIREPFPLGPVVDALRDTGHAFAEGAALSPVAGALRGLLPELGDVLPPAPEPLDDRAAERHRLFRGLREVLAALGPVVLVMEDLHWADEQTVEFLGYLLSRAPVGLSVVLTYRGDETSPDVQALATRLPDAVTRDHLALEPLDAAKTRDLVGVILGTDAVSEAFAEHVRERSAGLPLAVQELLALLRVRGELIPWEGGWVRRALEQLEVPAGVRYPVRERAARLSEPARALLEAAAVLQTTARPGLLADVCGLTEAEAADGLDEALESGLLLERDQGVAFRHVLAAQAIHDQIGASRRAHLHARAADALREVTPVPLGRMAHHLREAGRTAQWVDAAERAADQARALGDHAEAARLLQDVLRHAPLSAGHRERLTVRLGWDASRMLHLPDVADLLTAVLEDDPTPAVRGELLFLLAMHQDLKGPMSDRADRYRLLAEAVEHLEQQPQLAAWAMVALGWYGRPGLPWAEQDRWLQRALRTYPEGGDRTLRMFLLGKVAMAYVWRGDPRWVELTDRITAETDGRPRQRSEISAYYSVGLAAHQVGRGEAGDRFLEAALDGAVALDAGGFPEICARAYAAAARFRTGSWDGLAEEFAFLHGEMIQRPADRGAVDAAWACLMLATGELDHAGDLFRDVVRRIREGGLVSLMPMVVTALLRLAVARRASAAVLDECAADIADWEDQELWAVGVCALPALVEALLQAGHRSAAQATVARYERHLVGLDLPLIAPTLDHARGLLAAGQDGGAAARHLTAAAEGFRALGLGYEAAQATEHTARCLFAAGDAGAGAALLGAIDGYTRLGARWDVDRAARLARRNGLRPTVARRPGPEEERAGDAATGPEAALTPRQREVAELAAAGLTNREIARRLFLSTRTVDKHLSAILHRLDLRSRVELSVYMRSFGPSGGER
ncbi:ATPase [Wenjunlia vitaminophila]|uniref:ATPase n=1 Tax=Wenjunlia vitaminophila TaxID=76728 RepID=A0A0T6LS87_WENVI|nr:LuxR family transcriptional regulator [Wenjunlia vitaminophila]KRV48979.1 ATPase [Wenjunlia vitaminophila]